MTGRCGHRQQRILLKLCEMAFLALHSSFLSLALRDVCVCLFVCYQALHDENAKAFGYGSSSSTVTFGRHHSALALE